MLSRVGAKWVVRGGESEGWGESGMIQEKDFWVEWVVPRGFGGVGGKKIEVLLSRGGDGLPSCQERFVAISKEFTLGPLDIDQNFYHSLFESLQTPNPDPEPKLSLNNEKLVIEKPPKPAKKITLAQKIKHEIKLTEFVLSAYHDFLKFCSNEEFTSKVSSRGPEICARVLIAAYSRLDHIYFNLINGMDYTKGITYAPEFSPKSTNFSDDDMTIDETITMTMTLNETLLSSLGTESAPGSESTTFDLKIHNSTPEKILLSKLVNGKWIIGENIHPSEPTIVTLSKNLAYRIHKTLDCIIAIYNPPQAIARGDTLIMTISSTYKISITIYNAKEHEYREI